MSRLIKFTLLSVMIVAGLSFVPQDVSAQLLINEVKPGTSDDRWVEVYNPTDNDLMYEELRIYRTDLSNSVYITSAVPDVHVPAGGFYVFSDFTGALPVTAEGAIELRQTTGGAVVDTLDTATYPRGLNGSSYGRSTDGADEWAIFENPTRGTTNAIPEVTDPPDQPPLEEEPPVLPEDEDGETPNPEDNLDPDNPELPEEVLEPEPSEPVDPAPEETTEEQTEQPSTEMTNNTSIGIVQTQTEVSRAEAVPAVTTASVTQQSTVSNTPTTSTSTTASVSSVERTTPASVTMPDRVEVSTAEESGMPSDDTEATSNVPSFLGVSWYWWATGGTSAAVIGYYLLRTKLRPT